MPLYETPWGERDLSEEEARSLRGHGLELKQVEEQQEPPPAAAKSSKKVEEKS